MSVIIGIDVGGSTTKIVGFRANGNAAGEMISPLFVRATDPVTSAYGAFGKFIESNALSLSDIEKVLITGVGASHLSRPLYSLPCSFVPEFESVGRGGLYLSGLDEAIIVSLGTGTAIVHARKGETPTYMGGTGVGGGTILGLSRQLLGIEKIEHLEALAENGNIANVNLRIGDIVKDGFMPNMASSMTASNFGNLSDLASREDIALGIFNMVFESVGMLALFAARAKGLRHIVLTGNLVGGAYAKQVFSSLSSLFECAFIVPDNARFATVAGAALCHFPAGK